MISHAYAVTAYSDESIENTYMSELAITQELVAKAESVNGLWRDTKKLLTQAQEKASQNDYESGIKLLHETQFQAKAGYEQAISQSKLEDLIPYYLKH